MRRLSCLLALMLAPVAWAQSVVPAPPAACVAGTAGGFACSNVDLQANFTPQQLGSPAAGSCSPSYPNLCGNEVWGWTDPSNGKEYALAGLSNGTAFVDVTVPTAPVYLGRLPTATSTSTWRTIRVYQNYAFIGSEAGGHGVQVFDLTRLRDVASPPVTFTADARYTGNGNAHTLSINEATGFMYITGSRSGTQGCNAGGLHMVNIQNPLTPTFAGCFDADGYTHEAQCIVYDGPDTAYVGHEICVGYNQDHLAFVDVTNKAAPTLISSGFYPATGYTHQGWFTPDRRYILLDDEFDAASTGTRTVVMNVADLDNPTFRFDYRGPLHTYAHNLYIRGNYAYLSNYSGGTHIVDISGIDTNQFAEVAYFDTYSADNFLAYAGQWMNYPFFASGTLLANDGRFGLFVLRPTTIVTAAEPPAAPPTGFRLSAPVPNPTPGRARIDLAVAEAQHVRAEAFDALGRRVSVLFDGTVAAGATTPLALDATALPPGPYLVRVSADTFTTTARVSVVR